MTKKEALKILAPRAWTKPAYYAGFSPDGDYCVASRTRDSELPYRHNYEVILGRLKALPLSPENPGDWDEEVTPNGPVYDWRANHWACGWVEYLMVSAKAPDSVLIEAAAILKALDDYPILDEDSYGEKEWDEVVEAWNDRSLKERVDLCREAGVSIFAARRNYLPLDDSGRIFEALRG